MDFEMQNEMNRTRQILHMKKMMRLVKDKRAFDRYLEKLERKQKLLAHVKRFG